MSLGQSLGFSHGAPGIEFSQGHGVPYLGGSCYPSFFKLRRLKNLFQAQTQQPQQSLYADFDDKDRQRGTVRYGSMSHGPSPVGLSHGVPGSLGLFPPKPSPTPASQNLCQPQNQQTTFGGQQLYNDFEEKERLRFQVELEFVQCLGNPNYLNFLAQRGFFKQKPFINYLKYLHSYWTQPAYVKYLKYPLCLHFLELLQHELFRKEILNAQCAKFIDDQAILQWQQFTRKRIKLIQAGANPGQAAHQSRSKQVHEEPSTK